MYVIKKSLAKKSMPKDLIIKKRKKKAIFHFVLLSDLALFNCLYIIRQRGREREGGERKSEEVKYSYYEKLKTKQCL